MKNKYNKFTIEDLKEEYNTHYKDIAPNKSETYAESDLCEYFCPLEEECTRRIDGNYDKVYESGFLLKKYERSVAGKEYYNLKNVRNIFVLEEAANYLTGDHNNISNKYAFIDNRMRAIKLDMEILIDIDMHKDNKKVIDIFTQIIRFYVVALYFMYYYESDMYQIMEQLKKSLVSLENFCAKQKINLPEEIMSYVILCNMSNTNNTNIIEKTFDTKSIVIKKALEIFDLYVKRNYKEMFQHKYIFMHYCIFISYFDAIQKDALNMLKRGYNGKVKLEKISSMFGFDIREVCLSFYYEIQKEKESNTIDLKVKNNKNRTIKKMEVLKYNDNLIMKCMKNGMEDFNMYVNILEKYFKMLLYKRIVKKYVTGRIEKVLEMKKIQEANRKYDCLLLIYKKYFQTLIYRRIVTCFMSKNKQINTNIFKVLIIAEETKEIVRNSKHFVKVVAPHTFLENRKYLTEYNMFCYCGEYAHYERMKEMLWFLNICYVNINDINFNINDLIECNLHLPKKTCCLFSNLPQEDKIDYLLSNKKYLSEKMDVEKEIKNILRNKTSTFDMYIYK